MKSSTPVELFSGRPCGVSPVASDGPVAVIDGASCRLLLRYLRTVTPYLPAPRLAEIQPALEALAAAADAQHRSDRMAFAAGASAGWVSVAEAAELAGVSEQAIRLRLKRGTLAGERRGKAWRVDASQLSPASA